MHYRLLKIQNRDSGLHYIAKYRLSMTLFSVYKCSLS